MQLLQMSYLELSAAIERELEENPLLEVDEVGSEDEEPVESINEKESIQDNDWDEDEKEAWQKEANERSATPESEDVGAYELLGPDESIEAEIEWDDRLDHLDIGNSIDNYDVSFIENRSRPESLREHLAEQLALSSCSEDNAKIALVIFDNLSEDGYITLEPAALLAEINQAVPCDQAQVDEVLALVQQFSPLGICARNLQECLLIQLGDCDKTKTDTQIAVRVIKEFFRELAENRLEEIADILNIDLATLTDAVGLIRRLNPRPAASYTDEVIEYVEPEARVVKVDGKWQVTRIIDNLPALKISAWYDSYRQSLSESWQKDKSAQVQKDREFVKEQHARAKLFLSGLRFRQLNLMRVIDVIVKWQQEYFEHGASAMKPLILADVADELELHPSTVSRLTTKKYIHTPHGLLELKYFFTNRVGNQPGREHSGVAIRAMLKQVIDTEDSQSPFSDQKITDLLNEQNVTISRRTVTKYRESMSIPSGKQRKLLAR